VLLHFLFSQGRIAVAGLVSVPSRCINIVILIIIITIIIIVVVVVEVVVEAVVDAAPVATRR
jgi:hypothetical protein